MAQRAAFYVDGYNLYHGIDALGRPHLKWFSIRDYAEFVSGRNAEALVKVRYFSALPSYRPNSVGRHQTYLRALKSTGVEYLLGKFKDKPRRCPSCRHQWIGHEEKETDVNIAVQLIEDGIDDLADVVYVVSADSDLAPGIRVMQRKFPGIDFVSISPPNRPHASELVALATRTLSISAKALSLNRLPEQITDAAGTFTCPAEYALPPTTAPPHG